MDVEIAVVSTGTALLVAQAAKRSGRRLLPS
jgi:hypothetical protein